ncbi:MAG: NAD(P)/FAD-dependent oxidoreductase [Pseudonocardiaceae bacterium]|nr:NAD(P)/FAD-dependent oxidoreductase [Pseudonocardiaceae bacterium]
MSTLAIVGASLAGYSAAQQLRAAGFDGRLVMVGEENRLPYDRPPLSKDFLTGRLPAGELALADQADVDALGVDWELGRSAVALRPGEAAVELDDGRRVEADGVIVATGARPRPLPGAERVSGVHLLRTMEDAVALRAELVSGRPKVAIVGGGFIGAEVASSCVELGLEVTVVDSAELPLADVLGSRFARLCAQLHAERGVGLRFGATVAGLVTDANRVRGVRLADGSRLDADVVLVGIGVRANVDWLAGSGIDVGDGVQCDAGCVTSNPAVVAIGDVASVYRPELGRRVRAEHWTSATQQASTAVNNLLCGYTAHEFRAVPYFWSDQHGVRIQLAGEPRPTDEVTVTDGNVAERRFLAQYTRDRHPVGVLAVNHPRAFARARRALARHPRYVPI